MPLNDTQKMYHVQLTPAQPGTGPRRYEREHNLAFEELERRFLLPYRKGEPIVIAGRTVTMDALSRIRVFETEQQIDNILSTPKDQIREVTATFITTPPGHNTDNDSRPRYRRQQKSDIRTVFVVHGRNPVARDALFAFLRSIDLHPLEWSEAVAATGKASPYVGEVLNAAFSKAQAVVVLLTPDDEARLKGPFHDENDSPQETQLTGQARPNVLFEAGMAMARDEDRTLLVELGELRPFSDIGGRHTIRLDNTLMRRNALARRLQTAGCPVNLSGADWHTAGDFDVALALSQPVEAESTSVTTPTISIDTPYPLSTEGISLLLEAVQDKIGILRVQTMGGLFIQANGTVFPEVGNRRSEAQWDQALRELVELDLIESGGGDLFEVTHNGFLLADKLASAQGHSEP